jgi:hypothetical protein
MTVTRYWAEIIDKSFNYCNTNELLFSQVCLRALTVFNESRLCEIKLEINEYLDEVETSTNEETGECKFEREFLLDEPTVKWFYKVGEHLKLPSIYDTFFNGLLVAHAMIQIFERNPEACLETQSGKIQLAQILNTKPQLLN